MSIGTLTMPQVNSFQGEAKQIYGKPVVGNNIILNKKWADLLSPNLNIDGRIPIGSAAKYIRDQSLSKEIVVLKITVASSSPPAERESSGATEALQKLFDYLTQKQRFGVVTHSPAKKLKDSYIVPLGRSDAWPDFVPPGDWTGLDVAPRDSDSLLAVLILPKSYWDTTPSHPVGRSARSSAAKAAAADAPQAQLNPTREVLHTLAPPSHYVPPPVSVPPVLPFAPVQTSNLLSTLMAGSTMGSSNPGPINPVGGMPYGVPNHGYLAAPGMYPPQPIPQQRPGDVSNLLSQLQGVFQQQQPPRYS